MNKMRLFTALLAMTLIIAIPVYAYDSVPVFRSDSVPIEHDGYELTRPEEEYHRLILKHNGKIIYEIAPIYFLEEEEGDMRVHAIYRQLTPRSLHKAIQPFMDITGDGIPNLVIQEGPFSNQNQRFVVRVLSIDNDTVTEYEPFLCGGEIYYFADFNDDGILEFVNTDQEGDFIYDEYGVPISDLVWIFDAEKQRYVKTIDQYHDNPLTPSSAYVYGRLSAIDEILEHEHTPEEKAKLLCEKADLLLIPISPTHNLEKAKECLNEVLRLDPDNKIAQDLMVQIAHTELFGGEDLVYHIDEILQMDPGQLSEEDFYACEDAIIRGCSGSGGYFLPEEPVEWILNAEKTFKDKGITLKDEGYRHEVIAWSYFNSGDRSKAYDAFKAIDHQYGIELSEWFINNDGIESGVLTIKEYPGKMPCNPAAETARAENDRYLFIGYFKSGVFRYDKQQDTHALIYHSQASYDWPVELYIDNDDLTIVLRGNAGTFSYNNITNTIDVLDQPRQHIIDRPSQPLFGYNYKNIKWIDHIPYLPKDMEDDVIYPGEADYRGRVDIGYVDLDGDGSQETIKVIWGHGVSSRSLVVEVYKDDNRIATLRPKGMQPNFNVEDIDGDGIMEIVLWGAVPDPDMSQDASDESKPFEGHSSPHLFVVSTYKLEGDEYRLLDEYTSKGKYEPFSVEQPK
jgi:tetratricopeptide (TPR) repeat protein